METIAEIIPKVLLDLRVLPIKEGTRPMPESEKFSWQFDTLGDERLESMLSAARAFCRELKEHRHPRWLVLLGKSGIGKTHLLKKIGELYRDHLRYYEEPKTGALLTHSGGYTRNWPKKIEETRSGNHRMFQDMQAEYLLLLDDIGAEYETRYSVSKLCELVDARLGKWTVITANFALEQISEKMDPRIASRMIRDGSIVVDCDVEDYNLREKTLAV